MNTHLYGASASSVLTQAPATPRLNSANGNRQHAAHIPSDASMPPAAIHLRIRLAPADSAQVHLRGAGEMLVRALLTGALTYPQPQEPARFNSASSTPRVPSGPVMRSQSASEPGPRVNSKCMN